MTPTQLAIFALLLGLVVGAAVTLAVVFALRARDRLRHEASGELPEGVAAVLAGMDDAAAVVDSSFLLVATSTAADWLGLEAGRTLDDAELRSVVRTARSTGLSEAETLRLRRSELSSDQRLVTARATMLTPRLTLLTVRDIGERERLEQMRHDFVANTSHELKTPVGAVTLLSEAIDMAADDPDQVRVFAARLQAEAQRLAGLTGRIMNLSKLQSTDGLAEVRDVSVDEVVASAMDSHAVQAQGAGVEVVRGGERGLFVRGDAQILTDAIGNLVANAIAYSPQGSRVGIGVKLVDDVVEIAVSDQGIGIDEADQQRIFERFYRADQARSRRTGGTGLGLSIVKHAVSRHGGDVRLWSRAARGSTFTVVLPASASPLRDVREGVQRRTGKTAAEKRAKAAKKARKSATKQAAAKLAAAEAQASTVTTVTSRTAAGDVGEPDSAGAGAPPVHADSPTTPRAGARADTVTTAPTPSAAENGDPT